MRYLFFDIDGTLYDNKNDLVHESTIKAIKALSEDKNNILILCTGRVPFYMEDIDIILPFFKGKITINGHLIEFDKKIVRHLTFNESEVKEIVSALNELDIFGGYQSATNEQINVDDEFYYKIFSDLNMNVPTFIEDLTSVKDASQMYYFSTEEKSNLLKEKLTNFEVCYWGVDGGDILKKGISKYEAIKYFLKEFANSDDEIYAFGDGSNDYEMLKQIKNSACMGQGSEKTKSVASFVSTSVSENGLFNALKHFNLI